LNIIYNIFNLRDTEVASSGAETDHPPEYLSSSLVFSEVCVARSLVFCVVICRSLFVLLPFSFGHCVVCLPQFTDSDYPFGIFKLVLY